MKTNYIFLDVDGVLSYGGPQGLSAAHLDNLKTLVERTGARLVLTSMWRKPYMRDELRVLNRELDARGMEIEHHTAVLGNRAHEIHNMWRALSRREDVRICILDDDPNNEVSSDTELLPFLVKTDGYAGLTMQDVEKAVSILSA